MKTQANKLTANLTTKMTPNPKIERNNTEFDDIFLGEI